MDTLPKNLKEIIDKLFYISDGRLEFMYGVPRIFKKKLEELINYIISERIKKIEKAKDKRDNDKLLYSRLNLLQIAKNELDLLNGSQMDLIDHILKEE